MQNKYLRLMRLHQPTGLFLLLWPCLIALGLASQGYPSPKLILIFTLGSIFMRSAGCIFNDLVDYKFDKEVTRTKMRPISTGEVTKQEAIRLMLILLALAAILLLFLSKAAILLSLSSILLVIIYPYCKRFTFWPQLCLGFTFNIGSLIAWIEVKQQLNFASMLLYIALIFWTLGYDTIYAHQDREDDLKIGIKSTAILLGDKTEKYLNLFYTITSSFISFAGAFCGAGVHFYTLLSMPVALLYWQISTIDINNPSNCLRRFKINILVGGLMFLATFAVKGSYW